MGQLTDDILKWTLDINGSPARKELTQISNATNKLERDNKALDREMAKLEAHGKSGSKEWKAYRAQIAANNVTIAANKKRMAELRKEVGLNNLSATELRKEMRNLKAQMDRMSPNDPRWQQLNNQFQAMNGRVKQLRGGVTQVNNVFGKLKNMAGGLLPAFGFAAVVAGVKSVISQYAKFDDTLADVIKTTGLTRKEVTLLNNDLQKLDTRSSQEELLGLVRIGGKLGVEGRKDLLGFAAAADKINVALNEDLGGDVEETLRKVGKLVDIFKLKEKYGIEDAMLRVGSVINQVGATSTANEEYLVNFTERLAGFAPNADLAISDVIGLASTLDQMGQHAEVSTTVVGKLLVAIGQDIPKYSRIANMSIEEFSDLLKNDANEAMIRVLEGAKNTTGGLEGMAESLKTMGIDGQRSATVLGILTANTELLRSEQNKANAEFENGNSILAEFANKNESVQAKIEKLGKWFKNQYLNVLNAVNENLKSNTTLFKEQVSEVQNLQRNLSPMIAEYEDLQGKTELSADEQARIKTLIADIAAIAPSAITQIDEYGKALGISADAARNLIEQQKAYLRIKNTEEITRQEKELEKLNKRLEKQVNIKKVLVYSSQDEGYENLYTKRISDADAEIDRLSRLKEGVEAYLKVLKGESLIDADPIGGGKTSSKSSAGVNAQKTTAAKSLIEAQERLLEQAKAWPETTEAEIVAKNKRIQLIEKEIQRLKELGVETEKQQSQRNNQDEKNTNLTTGIDYDMLAFDQKQEYDVLMQMEADWRDYQKDSAAEGKKIAEQNIEGYRAQQKAYEELFNAKISLAGKTIDTLIELAGSESALGKSLFLLNKAIAIGEIWINLAKEKSAINAWGASLGPIFGPPYVTAATAKAIISAKVNTGIIAAQAIAGTIGSKKKTKGYAAGGFANEEQYIVAEKDKPEWIAPNWQLNNPRTRGMIDLLEYYRQNPMALNIQAIQPIKQYAAGGYSAQPDVAGSGSSQPFTPYVIDVDKFDRAVSRLMELEWKISTTDLSEKLRKLAEIEEQTNLKP